MAGTNYKVKYIFLMIFFFSGNVLAAPFLDCPMSISEMKMDEDNEVPCHDEMLSIHNSLDTVNTVPEISMGEEHTHSNHCECDQLCNSCSTITTALLPQLRIKSVKVPPENFVSDNSIIPSSTLESLFRPPIFA